jgi:3-deoxy-7-phosphoheptulonate synthase
MWLAELEAISEGEKKKLLKKIQPNGFLSSPTKETVLLAAKSEELLLNPIRSMGLVTKLKNLSKTEKQPLLSTRRWKNQSTVVSLGNMAFGGEDLSLIAGPCAVESEEQLDVCAKHLSDFGVGVLRAGAYKPRMSPYSYQGLGSMGIQILSRVAKKYNMLTISEVLDEESLGVACDYIDILQVGSRNMFNYALLKKLAKVPKPILLKRGFCATYQEWLLAAEYLLCGGNDQIILCERGIRTFETETRFTLDINAVAVIKELSHLPIIVDPSHATGKRAYVHRASRAAVAAGCDGIMLEVHPNPSEALSDAEQALDMRCAKEIVCDLRALHKVCL